MKVDVMLFAEARNVVGSKEITIELTPGSTVSDALTFMVAKYGDSFKKSVIDEKTNHYKMLFSVNKKVVQTNKVLNNGDILTIFPNAGGG